MKIKQKQKKNIDVIYQIKLGQICKIILYIMKMKKRH